MENKYLEKVAKWADDEYKNPATKSFLGSVVGGAGGLLAGAALARGLGKDPIGIGRMARTGAAIAGTVGMAGMAGMAAYHNSKIDDAAASDPAFQKQVDVKVLKDGKRSVIGNALITPYFVGGISAYGHNRDRYDAAAERVKQASLRDEEQRGAGGYI